MNRFLLKFLIIITFLFSISLILSYYFYISRPIGIKETMLFEVKKGDSVSKIINNLVEKKIVDNKLFLKIMVKLKGGDRSILHGFYLIKKDDSLESLWMHFLRGEVERYKVVIPEGYNIYQIAEVIENQQLGNKKRFTQLAQDKKFIKSLGLNLPTLEGYLFPSKYFFNPLTKEEEIIKEMVQKTFYVLTKELKVFQKYPKVDIHNLLILASLVEKEAKVKEELPIIAAVFKNRLHKKMKLQCDPTVIYGKKRFDGNITKADLRANNPYNTYVRYGLPPTPIANPSKEAILSVLNPANVDYLYFVSKNDGTHFFSNNLKDHNRAVYVYQKRKKKKGDT